MKIKKIEPSIGLIGKITNLFSKSKNDTYSCDYINNIVNKNVYSTGEVVIGEWLGKPLYRKVVEYNTSISGGNWFGVAYSTLGISNIDYLRVVSAMNRNSNNQYEEMISNQSRIIINTPENVLSLYLTDGALNKIIFVLEYTKTTD